jgi:hypothetical protein
MITQSVSLRSNQKIITLGWKPQETKIWAGFSKLWSALTGRSPRLLDLTTIQATWTLLDYCYVGQQMVLISQIRGSASEGRSRDFDANFRPLRSHNEIRWQGVYAARERGLKLPPVVLIQVGEVYFVTDGHHRISVAQARGEPAIEAEVTLWRVAGPLPWRNRQSHRPNHSDSQNRIISKGRFYHVSK